eukprot:758377-Pleurochrysis_carterae.AAC.1
MSCEALGLAKSEGEERNHLNVQRALLTRTLTHAPHAPVLRERNMHAAYGFRSHFSPRRSEAC